MLRLRFASLSMTLRSRVSTCHAERSEASQTTSTFVYLGSRLNILNAPRSTSFHICVHLRIITKDVGLRDSDTALLLAVGAQPGENGDKGK